MRAAVVVDKPSYKWVRFIPFAVRFAHIERRLAWEGTGEQIHARYDCVARLH